MNDIQFTYMNKYVSIYVQENVDVQSEIGSEDELR